MKPKKLEKKLVFKKKTIANISNIGMAKIQGGALSITICGDGYTCFFPTCHSCATNCNTCPGETCMVTRCPNEPC
jgi:hypothetical protein